MFDFLDKRQRERKRLKDERFAFLFEPPSDDFVICFDCESSSLDTKQAEILSLAAVCVDGNKVLTSRRVELFVKPESPLDIETIKKLHLRECDLENGIEVNTAIIQFLEFIGSRPLVGYFVDFQIEMINKYLKPLLGIELPNPQIDVSGLFYDKKYGVNNTRLPQVDLRFDSIMQELELPHLGKHDAYNDSLMIALMYIKLQHWDKSR